MKDFNHYSDYDAHFTYDLNGNIKTLKRYGKKENNTFGTIDNMNYSYVGNQLMNVKDVETYELQQTKYSDKGALSLSVQEFFYESNGNMYKDVNKKIENINYNHLNLPEEIEISEKRTNYIKYTNDAAGIKLKKEAGSTITEYVGSFIYVNNELKYILTDYGKIDVKIVNKSTGYHLYLTRQYNLTDHLI